MKLRSVLTAVLLLAFLSTGCGDVGVGSDIEVEDEVYDEVVHDQTLLPPLDFPAPEANRPQDKVSDQASETPTTMKAGEPLGNQTSEATELFRLIDSNASLAEQIGGTGHSDVSKDPITLNEPQEIVVVKADGSPFSFTPEEGRDRVGVRAEARAANTDTHVTETSRASKPVHDHVVEPLSVTMVDVGSPVTPVDAVPAESAPATATTDAAQQQATERSVFNSIDVEALSAGVDGNFGLGSGTEVLLDQLDEATQQVATLADANTALKAALAISTDNERALNKQVIELRDQLAAANNALAAVQGECQSRANISSTLHDEHTKQHAEQVRTLTDRLAAAERNSTTLEIRARLEKNEKIIARLSTDNCILELEAARHLHQEEVDELRAEIARLKKQAGMKGVLGVSQTPGLSSAAGSDVVLSAPTPSSAARTEPAAKGRRGTCDAAQCVDTLLSKYVFFWAAEHQADDSQSKKTRTATAPASAAPTSTVNAPPATLPEVTPKAPTPSTKAGRSDADFDTIGDEESIVLVALRVLQRASAAALAVYSAHVHPLLCTMLKYEFQLAAAVVKAVYEGAAWLWSSVLSPLYHRTLLPAAQNMYYTQIMPFVNSTVYPWYHSNLEQSVNTRLAGATAHWVEHYDEWFGYHIADPFEFLVGRMYIAQYFVVKFFTSEDLGEHLEAVGAYVAGFVPSVIAQLSSIGALQSYFGDNCVTAVSVLVYSSMALFVLLLRRVLLGVVAIAVVLMLSPLLIAVYVFAKLVGMFRPRKKAKRAVSGRPSRTVREGQHNGQHSRESSSGGSHGHSVHSAAPPQVATRQLPLDIPLTGAAPPGRELRSTGAVGSSGSVSGSVSGRPPQGRATGAPPVGGKYASGLPPRQGYPRGGELSQGGSGSNSGESLTKLGAPPLGAWANTEPKV